MKLLRICVCCLLLSPLLGIKSCSQQLVQLPKHCDKNAQTCTVMIDPTKAGCVGAGQELQDVPLGYSVIWAATNPPYSAQFWLYKTPFHTSSYSGAPVPNVPAGQAQKATGDTECNSTSASTGCYFPYFIYNGSQKCGDPGIHMVN